LKAAVVSDAAKAVLDAVAPPSPAEALDIDVVLVSDGDQFPWHIRILPTEAVVGLSFNQALNNDANHPADFSFLSTDLTHFDVRDEWRNLKETRWKA
jgi:hypothetical protein